MHTRSMSEAPGSRMRIKLVALASLLALVAAACGGEDEPTAAEVSPSPAEPILCPLTGEEAPDASAVERPALAVKIDNAPPARPQAGLENADLVYEELGEGGLTRFLSFFHCEDAEDLGPIRSARNVDPDIMQQYFPVLFGYSGANSQVLAKIGDTEGLVDLVHGSNGDAYRRESTRNAPYNLFSTSEALRGLEDAQGVEGPPSSGFVFNEDLLQAEAAPEETDSPAADEASPSAESDRADSISFQFSAATQIRYTYDPQNKVYLRFHGETPHNLASGEQVSAVNVIIYKVQIVDGTVRDASGSLTKDTTVVGSGEAVVLRGGKVVFGTWDRPTLDDNTTLRDRDGEIIELAPGNTWVHLVDANEAVNVGAGG